MELWDLLPKANSGGKLDCRKVLRQTFPRAGFNLRVEEMDALEDCAAFTIPDNKIIVFREDIYDLVEDDRVFGRSTVIHELAHVVLNHSATLHRGANLGEHKFFEDSEWQAKALTAATMMPVEMCRNVRSEYELAEMCGTSVEASSYRLQRLAKAGLI